MTTTLTEKNYELAFSTIWQKYGRGTLSFVEAAAELSYRTPKAAYSARRRDQFPVRLTPIGARDGVLVADLAWFLVTGQPCCPNGEERPKRGPGRPSRTKHAWGAK